MKLDAQPTYAPLNWSASLPEDLSSEAREQAETAFRNPAAQFIFAGYDLIDAVRQKLAARRTYQSLNSLSDEVLRDIGLERHEIRDLHTYR